MLSRNLVGEASGAVGLIHSQILRRFAPQNDRDLPHNGMNGGLGQKPLKMTLDKLHSRTL
jgi:hypothetical protein